MSRHVVNRHQDPRMVIFSLIVGVAIILGYFRLVSATVYPDFVNNYNEAKSYNDARGSQRPLKLAFLASNHYMMTKESGLIDSFTNLVLNNHSRETGMKEFNRNNTIYVLERTGSCSMRGVTVSLADMWFGDLLDGRRIIQRSDSFEGILVGDCDEMCRQAGLFGSTLGSMVLSFGCESPEFDEPRYDFFARSIDSTVKLSLPIKAFLQEYKFTCRTIVGNKYQSHVMEYTSKAVNAYFTDVDHYLMDPKTNKTRLANVEINDYVDKNNDDPSYLYTKNGLKIYYALRGVGCAGMTYHCVYSYL